MFIKKMMHYLFSAGAFICIFMAIFLLIDAFLNIVSQKASTVFLVTEIVLGILWAFLMILSKILFKLNYSVFPSNVEVANWRMYVALFQILLFVVSALLHQLNFETGQSFFLVILSHFYWVADIGYILPLMSK